MRGRHCLRRALASRVGHAAIIAWRMPIRAKRRSPAGSSSKVAHQGSTLRSLKLACIRILPRMGSAAA